MLTVSCLQRVSRRRLGGAPRLSPGELILPFLIWEVTPISQQQCNLRFRGEMLFEARTHTLSLSLNSSKSPLDPSIETYQETTSSTLDYADQPQWNPVYL